jgi:hypothetical protein
MSKSISTPVNELVAAGRSKPARSHKFIQVARLKLITRSRAGVDGQLTFSTFNTSSREAAFNRIPLPPVGHASLTLCLASWLHSPE